MAHGKDLARKEYWAHLERSPSFVLMYVPVEGAHEALAAVPKLALAPPARGVILVPMPATGNH